MNSLTCRLSVLGRLTEPESCSHDYCTHKTVYCDSNMVHQ